MTAERKRKRRVARIRFERPTVKREPDEADVEVLRFVSEQTTVTLDQLARFFGIYLSDVVRFTDEMVNQGWIHKRRLVKGEEPYVWQRAAGAEHAGLDFSPVKPTLATVAHLHAITEARLYLHEHAPEGEWVCERMILRSQRRGWGKRRRGPLTEATVHIPDGLFKIEDEVHAIEAEISLKRPEPLEEIIAQHSSRYDAVVYFCAPRTYREIRRHGFEERYPRLFTCCLVDDLRLLAKGQFRVEDDHRHRRIERDPEEWEVAFMDLLVEQGAIPMDLVARFLGCDAERADAIVSHLLEAGFVMRARPEPEMPDWVYLVPAADRFTTLHAKPQQTTLGGLPRVRALSEVRLRILELTKGTVSWTSGRELRRLQGQKGSLPDAAVVEETVESGERCRYSFAVDVKLNLGQRYEKMFEIYQTRMEEFDYVVWYCTPVARRTALRLKKEFHCPKLIIRTLPGYAPPRDGRRRLKKSDGAKPVVFEPVGVRDVEDEAFQVVAMASGKRADPIRIKSIERRKKYSGTEYRIGTDDGRWCVRLSAYGWKAEEILE